MQCTYSMCHYKAISSYDDILVYDVEYSRQRAVYDTYECALTTTQPASKITSKEVYIYVFNFYSMSIA